MKIYVLNYDFRKGERENNKHLTALLIIRLAATGFFSMHQVFVYISDGSVTHLYSGGALQEFNSYFFHQHIFSATS